MFELHTIKSSTNNILRIKPSENSNLRAKALIKVLILNGYYFMTTLINHCFIESRSVPILVRILKTIAK